MTGKHSADRANGYEAVFRDYQSSRAKSNIGVATVLNWAKSLPSGVSILDLGCGHGVPLSQALLNEGFNIYAIDASPSMIAAFRTRFPYALVECNAIEVSRFFDIRFDGIIAWGLMFLLAPDIQKVLIHKVSAALKPGGGFLFTAPYQACEWLDNLTGKKSVSLGAEAYCKIVRSADLELCGEAEDEGENHYYFIRKPNNDS